MIDFKKFKAAAVQASPVYLNADATVDKACSIIAEASAHGASLVAFPEVFVSAYPYWNWILTPLQGSKWFEHLYVNSIDVPGKQVERLCQCAKANHCNVVIGVNERAEKSAGTLYNTNLIISAEGELIGKHRKLVPTWAEKLTWTGGDGSSLKVYDTSVGPLGTLACGENTNSLARFALLAQGELVHVANYISLPVAPVDYNMAEAIKIRAAAHSFEGKIFTIASCSTVSEEIIRTFEKEVPGARELFNRKNSAFSGILDPGGQLIGDALIDQEGIVYADIDLGKCIQPKQMHDITGHYNRFDIFELKINTAAQTALTFTNENNKKTVPAKDFQQELVD